MRILIAGASGAIGRPLTHMLKERGHDVFGMTRSEKNRQSLISLGATVVVCDALDEGAVLKTVQDISPEVIINQLTALKAPFNPRKYAVWIEPTNVLRREGTRNLARAAVLAGTQLLISQSLAFAYAPGDSLRSEDDPLFEGFPPVEAIRELEDVTLNTPGLKGIVLRYGFFYGPGTVYANDGDMADLVRHRKFPVIGKGGGCFPFIHIDDAAQATVAALDYNQPGVFNIVDDDPAAMREWLPFYAKLLGAKPPRRIPAWLMRPIVGELITNAFLGMPCVSNAKAKQVLNWRPRYASWRDGFQSSVGMVSVFVALVACA